MRDFGSYQANTNPQQGNTYGKQTIYYLISKIVTNQT
jgi:hypothetical protein